jgi:hypothetical protein
LSPQLAHAGEWLLNSGIQESNGGVARYHRTDSGRNLAASTEITGYALSAFVYLFRRSGQERYLDAARRAARFLVCDAWDPRARLMPFEIGPAEYAYFFDCGIIVRGLLLYWQSTHEQQALDVAVAVGEFMMRDFASAAGDFHPVLALPGKTPLKRDPLRWSQSAGCYQLKSAMAWWDLYETTGDTRFRAPFEAVLEASLAGYREFLPGHPDRLKVMDRLHAFSYFLEGLLPRVREDARCAAAMAEGIGMVARHLREIAPDFARSDVFAQLLRARMYAHHNGIVPLDEAAASWEAAELAGFQRPDGGYWFGRKAGEWLPFSNPVSTAFAAQALEFRHAGLSPRQLLI